MRPIGVAIVVFALALAGLVYFVVPGLMNRPVAAVQPAPQAPRVDGNEVLVATRNLPAGSIMKADDVRWQRWPEDGIDPNFLLRTKGITPQADAAGRVVLRGFAAGEPITVQRLLRPGDSGFLAAALTPGKRAISVPIDAVSGNAGFIVPGDSVDLLLAEKFNITYVGNTDGARPSHKQASSVVLRDIRVLTIDQETRDMDTKPKLGRTATLEVDLMQAQKVSLAMQMGTLSLALRSLVRPETAEVMGGTVQDFEVSSFLGRLQNQQNGNGVRVYHGATIVGQGH